MTVGFDTVEEAIDALTHDAWPFRLVAVRFLADFADRESVRAALIPVLSDHEESVQVEVARALVHHLDDPEVFFAMFGRPRVP